MKICIDARYVFPKIDGIGRYIYNLIDQITLLTKDNKDLHFIILEIEEFASQSILRNFDGRHNISFIKIPIKPQTLKNHFVGKYLKNIEIDLYHYPQFDLPWFVSGFKIITSILDMNPQTLPNFFPSRNGWIKRYYSIFTNWVALKKSDKLITISENTKKELMEFYNVRNSSKIQAIPIGIDPNFFNTADEDISSKILLRLKKKYNFDRYFLYVGNNRPHKNLERILTAFKLILNQIEFQLKFLLIGQQLKNNPDVYAMLIRLGIVDKVINNELTDVELNTVYSGAEAFVFCSLSEGFGLPILEAMSHKIPVITSNLSSMKEIAEGAACLVDPYSVEEIQRGMLKILTCPDYRKELSIKGFERAKSYTWENCARQTLETYQQVIKL